MEAAEHFATLELLRDLDLSHSHHKAFADGRLESPGCLRARGVERASGDDGAASARASRFIDKQIIFAAQHRCGGCGALFAEPGPLALHRLLGCAPPAPPPSSGVGAGCLRSTPPACADSGHACAFCGKRYSRRYGLKIHIRTHTGYRPLRCRHCARAFGDPSNLNKHERLHARRADPPPSPRPPPPEPTDHKT